MRAFTYLLIGMLLGQLSLMPVIYKLIVTPRIESELVDVRDDYFVTTEPMNFLIGNMSSVLAKDKKYLYIHIRTQKEVVAAYKKIYGEEIYALLGFYDRMKNIDGLHQIYSVNSTSVLAHEIRHATEGYFHRGESNDDIANKCPITEHK